MQLALTPNMSAVHIKLASLFLREYFGEIVDRVCTHLLKNGSGSLRAVIAETKEKPNQVRKVNRGLSLTTGRSTCTSVLESR